MGQSIKAIYDSKRTVENVMFDLVGTGVPHDDIEMNRDKHQLNIHVPEESKATIMNILKRHNPEQIR